jgi:mycothiol synthase
VIGGVVHAYRERGLGRELFGWQVARIREMHAERPDEHWHIETGALTRDEKSQRFFTRFGFVPVRYQFDMVADTTAAVQVAPPDGIHVVPYTPDLVERVYAAHREAFADHWNHQQRPFDDWVRMTVGADIFVPDTARVALDGDEVAAYVLTYDADDDL